METRKAVQQLSSGKAPGRDGIPAEVYKAGGDHGRETGRVVSLYVEEGCYPIIVYGCIHNPPIQAERKSQDLKCVTTTEASPS